MENHDANARLTAALRPHFGRSGFDKDQDCPRRTGRVAQLLSTAMPPDWVVVWAGGNLRPHPSTSYSVRLSLGRSANSLVESDQCREFIGLYLDQRQFHTQQGALCIDLLDIGRIAGAVPIPRMAQRVSDGGLLG